MRAPLDLNSWLMPTTAMAEWLTLSALLDELPDRDVSCRLADPGAWWPDRKQLDAPATRMAVRGCWSCLARDACLDYALAANEREGVWGGLLPAERQALDHSAAA